MSDETCVIVKAGSAGGVVVLLGRQMSGGEWSFSLATVEHSVELLGEQDCAPVQRRTAECVDSCGEGFQLLDRYPWAQLYPVEVHPLFVEGVRLAVAERLALLPCGSRLEKQRKQWDRVLLEAVRRITPRLQG